MKPGNHLPPKVSIFPMHKIHRKSDGGPKAELLKEQMRFYISQLYDRIEDYPELSRLHRKIQEIRYEWVKELMGSV